MDNRGKDKKKFNLIAKKDCAIKSIYEVNCFLSKLNTVNKITKLTNSFKPH